MTETWKYTEDWWELNAILLIAINGKLHPKVPDCIHHYVANLTLEVMLHIRVHTACSFFPANTLG